VAEHYKPMISVGHGVRKIAAKYGPGVATVQRITTAAYGHLYTTRRSASRSGEGDRTARAAERHRATGEGQTMIAQAPSDILRQNIDHFGRDSVRACSPTPSPSERRSTIPAR